jgi:hypothetical protein
LGQDLVGFIQGDRPLFLLPGVLSQCERIVIDPPTDLKRLLKESDLRFGRIDSVTAPTTEVVGIYGFATNALPPQCNSFITIPLSLFHFYGICYYIVWKLNNINVTITAFIPRLKVVGFLPV